MIIVFGSKGKKVPSIGYNKTLLVKNKKGREITRPILPIVKNKDIMAENARPILPIVKNKDIMAENARLRREEKKSKEKEREEKQNQQRLEEEAKEKIRQQEIEKQELIAKQERARETAQRLALEEKKRIEIEKQRQIQLKKDILLKQQIEQQSLNKKQKEQKKLIETAIKRKSEEERELQEKYTVAKNESTKKREEEKRSEQEHKENLKVLTINHFNNIRKVDKRNFPSRLKVLPELKQGENAFEGYGVKIAVYVDGEAWGTPGIPVSELTDADTFKTWVQNNPDVMTFKSRKLLCDNIKEFDFAKDNNRLFINTVSRGMASQPTQVLYESNITTKTYISRGNSLWGKLAAVLTIIESRYSNFLSHKLNLKNSNLTDPTNNVFIETIKSLSGHSGKTSEKYEQTQINKLLLALRSEDYGLNLRVKEEGYFEWSQDPQESFIMCKELFSKNKGSNFILKFRREDSDNKHAILKTVTNSEIQIIDAWTGDLNSVSIQDGLGLPKSKTGKFNPPVEKGAAIILPPEQKVLYKYYEIY